MSQDFADRRHALFLGRGVQYPVAMEGALKLKSNMEEVSACDGQLYVFADAESNVKRNNGAKVIDVPPVGEHIASIVYTVPPAAARLPRRRPARHGRRPAAQPGEVSNGGVAPGGAID